MKHNWWRILCSVAMLLVAANAFAEDVTRPRSLTERKTRAMLSQRGYQRGNVGILFKELGKGSSIIDIDAEKPLVLASVSKLVNGAAAYDLLGMGYRFTTPVHVQGTFDSDSGIVHGDLVIRGRGDPGFTAERLWLFVQHLSHRGLRKITGDLLIDDCFFDSVIAGPGFSEDKSSKSYEAPTAALSANFNTVAVHVAPGAKVGAPLRITPFPQISGVRIISTAKTTPVGTNNGVQVNTQKFDGKTAIMVYGSMALDEEPTYKYRKVWETAENFGWVMQGLFAQCGIALEGAVRRECFGDSLVDSAAFYSFTSQPLNEFIKHMFKYSSNFAAEMIFKTMAAENDSLPGSWTRGAEVVGQWWQDAQLPGKVMVKNGSGMGSGNRLNARQVVALLEHAWADKTYGPDFVSALSVSGIDGTLEERFRKSHLKGHVRAKTGTLNSYGVANLAGYLLLKDKTYVFAILINNSGKDQVGHWGTHQTILELAAPHKKSRSSKE